MVTNMKLKVFLMKAVFTPLSFVNFLLKHNQQKIVFYINLEFRDNSKSLFEYLVNNGYNEKYHIICSCLDYKDYQGKEPKNVKFVSKKRCIIEFLTAGKVIYSIGHLPINAAKDQEILQTWHGAPLKDVDAGVLITHPVGHRHYTKVLSTSEHFKSFWSRHFQFDINKIFVGGYPRNEVLFGPSPNYDFGEYQKIILWAPTFRRSKMMGVYNSDSENFLPIVKTCEFKEFNDYLRSIGVKVVVKLHPAQDLDHYSAVDLDNFILLSNVEFRKRGMDLYRFMVQCDGLITDYSSIYYDYLLLDRPICFTIDDEKDYSQNRGFWTKEPDRYKPGMKVKSLEELKFFCKSVVEGVDSYKEERIRVNALANDYMDGKFCDRILNEMNIKL